MLVVISDLHLTDKSSGETINAGAFHLFMESVKRLAHQASLREGGSFVPVEACHLVLLGDILDPIRSIRWRWPDGKRGPDGSEDSLRPWSPEPERIAERVALITSEILKQNSDALQYFRTCAKKFEIEGARPGKKVKVPLKIHYMVGNHDWFYHLKGDRYDEIRAEIKTEFGLCHGDDGPFPHTLDESPELKRLFDRHRVYGQHGDVHDPLNYRKDRGRDVPSLGDAIVIELLNRFPEDVLSSVPGADEALYRDLKEIDNVRPSLTIPSWINVTLQKYPEPIRLGVADVWGKRVKAFLKLDFLKELKVPSLIGRILLGVLLAMSQRMGWVQLLSLIQRVALKISPFFNLDPDADFVKHVYSEPAYLMRPDAIDYFVYGHTHNPEIIPVQVLEETAAKGKPAKGRARIYFNSGTWRTVHQKAENKHGRQGFARYQVMTFVAFYQNDDEHGHERRGRTYEVWNGQLSSSVDGTNPK